MVSQLIYAAVRLPWQHISCNEEIIKISSGMFQPKMSCQSVKMKLLSHRLFSLVHVFMLSLSTP